MIYTKQLEDEILGTHRKEKDAQAKFEEDKLEIIKDISRVKAEMNTMFKEKSSIKSKIMEVFIKCIGEEVLLLIATELISSWSIIKILINLDKSKI